MTLIYQSIAKRKSVYSLPHITVAALKLVNTPIVSHYKHRMRWRVNHTQNFVQIGQSIFSVAQVIRQPDDEYIVDISSNNIGAFFKILPGKIVGRAIVQVYVGLQSPVTKLFRPR